MNGWRGREDNYHECVRGDVGMLDKPGVPAPPRRSYDDFVAEAPSQLLGLARYRDEIPHDAPS